MKKKPKDAMAMVVVIQFHFREQNTVATLCFRTFHLSVSIAYSLALLSENLFIK